jgi:protein O-GlcNAcase / histone acetyltransferase
MASRDRTELLTGVIEGFYGQPWTREERFELFELMAAWGLNTYLYGPKDDLKHRTIWRELYSTEEAAVLQELIERCTSRGLRFIYALGPGLDIRYSQETDLDYLGKRFEQMLSLGCNDFALLFDDIPDRMQEEALRRWGSLASAQAHVANAMLAWTRQRAPGGCFLFCPTPYCGRMAERKHGGEGYLATIGRELAPEIDVFWTGPEIISESISVEHVQELERLLRRKPVIWDNLHANDYDGRRFFCGPYSGRPRELRHAVRGFLSNPNTEHPLNYVPLRTLAEFVQGTGDWKPREAYHKAVREWLPRWATVGSPVSEEDLVLLGDCYYLPHEEGPLAETLYATITELLSASRAEWAGLLPAFKHQAARVKEICTKLTELKHRPLFYALSRRIWDLREEMDLLERYVDFVAAGGQEGQFQSDFHLPGTYRGGMVARLQRLLSRAGTEHSIQPLVAVRNDPASE